MALGINQALLCIEVKHILHHTSGLMQDCGNLLQMLTTVLC